VAIHVLQPPHPVDWRALVKRADIWVSDQWPNGKQGSSVPNKSTQIQIMTHCEGCTPPCSGPAASRRRAGGGSCRCTPCTGGS
jgi:hypothetical protein